MRMIYFDYKMLMRTYEKTIEVSGGGISGVKDKGQIESVLDHIQTDLYAVYNKLCRLEMYFY